MNSAAEIPMPYYIISLVLMIVGNLLLAFISVVIFPAVRSVASSLMALRDDVQKLMLLVKDPTTGVLVDIAALQLETRKHRNWLIRLSAESGTRIEDRT